MVGRWEWGSGSGEWVEEVEEEEEVEEVEGWEGGGPCVTVTRSIVEEEESEEEGVVEEDEEDEESEEESEERSRLGLGLGAWDRQDWRLEWGASQRQSESPRARKKS